MKNLFFLFLLLGACSDMFPAEISPAEIKKNNLILDVRTPAEHEELALIQEHWFVPLDQLEPTSFIREHHLDGSKPLYILCRSGKRAEIAAQKFKQAGLKKVAVIRGGIIAAEKMGLPIKK